MESLSPKQVREIKDLYKNVYKQEVVEETGDFDDLFESEEFQSLSDELKENIVKKMQDSMAKSCLLYTSPSPRDLSTSRMPSSA